MAEPALVMSGGARCCCPIPCWLDQAERACRYARSLVIGSFRVLAWMSWRGRCSPILISVANHRVQ
jgi:hypothetical protein